jgi:hypothetical protein
MTRRALALLALSTATAAAEPAAPLCDRDGAPACGNIGQAGRPRRETRIAAARPIVPPATQVPAFAVRARALLEQVNHYMTYALRPLLDAERRPACGNVMGKGGHRSCR